MKGKLSTTFLNSFVILIILLMQVFTVVGVTPAYAQGALYTVTYAHNPAGGTGTLPTQADVAEGGAFTVASGAGLTRAGYTFAGWNDGTSTYAAGSTYTMGTSNVTLTAQWSPTAPPPLPSSFYGEIHVLDNPPSAGGTVDIFIPGLGTPITSSTIFTDAPNLVYVVEVPGDIAGTTDREGAVEGEALTFKIGSRTVATAVWHSGTSVRLNIHPPQALPGGPYTGTVGSPINFSGSANDWGTDAATYQWDWDNDGTYDTTGQNPSHTFANFGNYTVGLKVTDAKGGEGTATTTVNVGKAASTTTVSCTAGPFGFTGSAQTPCSATVTGAGGLNQTLTVSYSDNINTGTATASASFAGDANYEASSDTETFTIGKASSTTTVTCTAGPFAFTGSAQTPCSATVTGAGGLNQTLTVSYSDNINAGTATASASFAGDANYEASSDTETFTIGKASSTTTVSCDAGPFIFTGSAQTPCSATVTGAGGLNQTLTVSYSDNINAGTATASASFAGDANYEASSDTETFTIGKASSTTTVSCDAGPFIFTGSAQTPCSATVTGAGGLNQTLTVSYSDNINAGTATASASFAGDANHEVSSDTETFTIGKATSTTTVTCDAGPFGFTGSAQTPCSATVTGAGGLNQTLTVSYSDNINAGTATASASFAGDANYEASSDTETFTIGKAASTTTVTCDAGPFIFTGSAQTPCSATVTGAGGLNQTLTVSYSDNINAGTATASASFAGDANYEASSDTETFTISPASATITLSDMTQVYDGTPKSATVTTDPAGRSVSVTYNGSSTAPTAPGTYAVVATITDPNYTGTQNGSFVIQAKHSIALVEGWNLVSFNVRPSSTAVASVLSSLNGNYNLVYAWDATGARSASGNWMKYDPTGPSFQNSLLTLDESMGFWIYMTAADTLDVIGSEPVTTNVALLDNVGGWNLVSYASMSNRALPAALQSNGVGTDFSLVYSYRANDATDPWKLFDRTGPSFANDLTTMTPGWGYWIKVNADRIWNVKYLPD